MELARHIVGVGVVIVLLANSLSLVAQETTSDITETIPAEALRDESTTGSENTPTISFDDSSTVVPSQTTTPIQHVIDEAQTSSAPDGNETISSNPDDSGLLASSPGEVDSLSTSVTLPSGVVYQILSEGKGEPAGTTATLLFHYTLYLSDGRRIESSRDAEMPVPLELTRGEGSFIEGFEIGTDNMKVGETRKLYVPSELGYGERGKEAVPPNAQLIFEVELVAVK